MTYNVVTIDDNREISELLAIVLRHPDVVLNSRANAREGLALIQAISPDLIILDVMMPGVTGWQVYDALRASPRFASVPIVMVTVVPERASAHRVAANSAIDAYVTKPFDVTELRGEIERLLGVSLWNRPRHAHEG